MSLGKNIRDFFHGAAYGAYERELRLQAAELNDLFLLLCYMEIAGLPNPATLYLLDVYPYLLEQFHLWHRRMGMDRSPLGNLPLLLTMATLRPLIDKRVLFFGGKGGVGKTTSASALAVAASHAGKRVLLVSTDPAHSTSDIFERPIGPEIVPLLPNLHGLEIDGAFESARYVAGVKERIQGLFGHHILKEANKQIDLAASMPGAEEMALFDRIGALIRGEDDRFDLIVFDTAPTGHTLRLIRMPELMEAWIRALSKSRQAMLGIEQDDATDPVMISLKERLEHLREFRARLLSPRVCAFVLVMVAERLPIEETARAIEQLQEAGVTIGGLVVNRVLPATSPDPFLRARHDQEQIYLDEIDRRFASHLKVRVPQLPSDVHGVETLEQLSNLLVKEKALSS